MPLVPMRTLLDAAAKHNFGLCAININNMEQIQAVMEAARETESPALLQASRGALRYTDGEYLRGMIEAACRLYPEIPFSLHLDHGNGVESCLRAMQLGFTSVMMDGSLAVDGKSPSDYEYNVSITRQVVELAHKIGVSVEGELGCLGSLETLSGEKEDGHGVEGKMTLDQLLTNPDQAVDFVEKTGVDALAVAIGTSHGAYKFTSKPTGDVLALATIEEIHRRLPHCHLVMHGSSSVPSELVEMIRKYGGEMKPSFGVPIEDIQAGIRNGVRKINVDTDNRLAMTAAIRKRFSEDPSVFDPRSYMQEARVAMKEVCAARMIAFGQAGMAKCVPLVSLQEMAAHYAQSA